MIIVDLDDTILDTGSTLRRAKLSDAAAYGPVGFEAYVLERAGEHRRGSDIIRDACALFEVDEEIEALMIAEYYEGPAVLDVPLIDGAREALESFKAMGEHIVCVTAGREERQRAKITGAALEFDDVFVVSEPEDKALVYADLCSDADPSRIVVIGDSLTDVLPARDLGMHAVLFAPALDAWDGPDATCWEDVVTIVRSLV